MTTRLCLIQGCQSEAGKRLNGRVAELMGANVPTVEAALRLIVRLHPGDHKRDWIGLKPETVQMMSPSELQACGKMSSCLCYEDFDLASWSDLLILQMVNLADPNYGHVGLKTFHGLVLMHFKEQHAYLRQTMCSLGSLFWLLHNSCKFALVLLKCDSLQRALYNLSYFWETQCDELVSGECWGVDTKLMYIEDAHLLEVRNALARLCETARVGFVVQSRLPCSEHEAMQCKILEFLESGCHLLGRGVQHDEVLLTAPKPQHDETRLWEKVIDEVEHMEPAEQISPAETKKIVAIQEADFVSRNFGSGPVPEPLEKVLLLQLNRVPADLVSALTKGLALDSVRTEMQEEKCSFVLESGAFVFVKPWQYPSALQAAKDIVGLQGLKSSHIVFGASVEHLLQEAINEVRPGVWAKYQKELATPLEMSSTLTDAPMGAQSPRCSNVGNSMSSVLTDASMVESTTSDPDGAADGLAECIVKHTFLCWVPQARPLAHSGAHTV